MAGSLPCKLLLLTAVDMACLLAHTFCSAIAVAAATALDRPADSAWLANLGAAIVAQPALATSWLLKPVINGKDVATLFGVHGKEIGPLVDLQIEWLIVDPSLSAAECEARIRAHLGVTAAAARKP